MVRGCRAIRAGSHVYVTGTAAVAEGGGVHAPGDAYAQTVRCLDIVEKALADLGAGVADVVRTRIFLVDPADAADVSAAHGRAFADVRPAATMVVVAGLLDPRWRVEIEAEVQDVDRQTSAGRAEVVAMPGEFQLGVRRPG